MYLKPQFETKHRQGANRNGKHINLRHGSLPGFVYLDKSGAWAYKEHRDDKLVTVTRSQTWGDHMDALAPEIFSPTAEWVSKISLRQRAFN